VAKFGSKAIPSRPRSPVVLTLTVTKGVERSAPFLMTRNLPPCSLTKIRPSGAISITSGC
jgi:hypothetical protein